MRNAVIDANGNIVNIVDVEIGAEWSPPEGHTLVQSDTACIGWTYANGSFVAPALPAPTPPTIEQQIAALEAQQTPRRIREAIKDPTWLDALDAQIAALRAQLPKS